MLLAGQLQPSDAITKLYDNPAIVFDNHGRRQRWVKEKFELQLGSTKRNCLGCKVDPAEQLEGNDADYYTVKQLEAFNQ